jgi:nucleotide-binding universal stress UspA family protein
MKILFCSDGSSQAERAVRFGAQIAAACQAESSILGIIEKVGNDHALLQALQRAQDIFKEYHLDAEIITKEGRPVREIVKGTMAANYDLVVIGAVCKSPFLKMFTPWRTPLRTHKIIESVKPPVLVVFCERPALRRILVCSGGADYIRKAIEFAGKIAQCVDAVVNLFHVMPEPPAMYADLIRMEDDADLVLKSNSKLGQTLRQQKELLEHFGVFGELRLRHGEIVPELLKELRQTAYDLVVAGSWPAEDKLHRYVMGDVTREIVNRAELPVLVIRTGQRQTSNLFKDVLARVFRRSQKSPQASQS